MLKFDYLVKNIEIFMGQFIMPFCFERQNVQFKIVKINSELLKIKKIKQSLWRNKAYETDTVLCI